MARINVVPVIELCDQHLKRELKELPQIPNGLIEGKLKYQYLDSPLEYTLGQGHIKFFTDKLRYLYTRYVALHTEASLRGFDVPFKWPDEIIRHSTLRYWNDYRPTHRALALNRAKINKTLPSGASWSPHV